MKKTSEFQNLRRNPPIMFLIVRKDIFAQVWLMSDSLHHSAMLILYANSSGHFSTISATNSFSLVKICLTHQFFKQTPLSSPFCNRG